jgi:hypothetical protein
MSKFLALLMVCVFAVALAGCATGNGYYDPVRSAGAGALGGATTGAAVGSIIGAATGNPGTGAGIGAGTGAIVGAVGGYLYALNRNSQLSSVPAAAQTYNFAPSRANMPADQPRFPYEIRPPMRHGRPDFSLLQTGKQVGYGKMPI